MLVCHRLLCEPTCLVGQPWYNSFGFDIIYLLQVINVRSLACLFSFFLIMGVILLHLSFLHLMLDVENLAWNWPLLKGWRSDPSCSSYCKRQKGGEWKGVMNGWVRDKLWLMPSLSLSLSLGEGWTLSQEDVGMGWSSIGSLIYSITDVLHIIHSSRLVIGSQSPPIWICSEKYQVRQI